MKYLHVSGNKRDSIKKLRAIGTLNLADWDFIYAKYTYLKFGLSIADFLFQQATEKYLKVIIFQETSVLPTTSHNLLELLKEAKGFTTSKKEKHIMGLLHFQEQGVRYADRDTHLSFNEKSYKIIEKLLNRLRKNIIKNLQLPPNFEYQDIFKDFIEEGKYIITMKEEQKELRDFFLKNI